MCVTNINTIEISNNLKGYGHSDNRSRDDGTTTPRRLEIKCIDLGSETTLGTVVVYRTKSFIIETKDDTKDNSYEAA